MNSHPETPGSAVWVYTDWFKSRFSPSQETCVEVRFDGPLVHLRDSKDLEIGPVISISVTEWQGFVDEVLGVAAAGSNHAVRIEHLDDGAVRLRAIRGGVALTYTSSEWAAFTAGARHGQFTVVAAG
ncbi:protein of unknown function (DUF397) [Saccharomonospora marina XMU15]|uniref:DUF397 domain-containing protein n=1 Tax=Saccharomonospora marina XMU15 TaxID=882083 RepID=H5X660_9PSEU|nr:protein of unknown function (DUF397) [Saccharomonospora marina XMU15]